MSLLLGREAQNPIPQPDGHHREHRCWWCASNALLDQAARNEQPLARPLHLGVALEHCPHRGREQR